MSCYYINQITDALRNHGEDRLPNRITIHIISTIDLMISIISSMFLEKRLGSLTNTLIHAIKNPIKRNEQSRGDAWMHKIVRR